MTAHAIHRAIRNPISFSTVRTLILLLALLAFLGITYLVQSSQATLTGQRVQDLREQQSRLDRETDQLEYDIAVLSAPAKVAERAKSLGLHPAPITQTVFILVKHYPAAQSKPHSAMTNPPNATSNDDSFIAAVWNEFLARLGLTLGIRPVEASP